MSAKIFRLFSSASQRDADYVHGLPNLEYPGQGERRFQRTDAADSLQKSIFRSQRSPTSSDDPTSWVS